MSDGDTPKPAQDSTTGRFLPGNNGGAGRPRGARNKLSEAFLADMFEAWQMHGKKVIAEVIAREPCALLRAVVAVLPKDVEVGRDDIYDLLSDTELRDQYVKALRDAQEQGIDLVTPGEPQRRNPVRLAAP